MANSLMQELNRLANGGAAYRAPGDCVESQLAANQWAGTVGLDLKGALNAKAGNPHGTQKAVQGVLNQIAGTTGLGEVAAAASIPA